MEPASAGGTSRGAAAHIRLVLLLSFTVGVSGCGGSPPAMSTPSSRTLTSILISPVAPTVALDQRQQLTATGLFSDGSKQDMTQTVAWASTQPAVASISKSGLAWGKQIGSAKLTATSGSVTSSDTLTVSAAALVSIALSPQSLSVPKGAAQQLNAIATFSDGTQQNITNSATWSSAQSGIATVSATGVVTAQAVGSATITAASASVSGSATLTVSPAVLVAIAVSPQSLSVPKGRTQQLNAIATFSDGTQQDITNSATWSSASSSIATVSATGVVTAQAVGSATITVASASVSGSDTLTVSPAILVSIAVAPANSSIVLGATEQFTSTGTFSDGSTQGLTNSTAWSSANSSLVSISPAGVAVADAVGSTTISANLNGLSGSANVKVQEGSTFTESPFDVLALSGTHLAVLQGLCGFLKANTKGICTCGTVEGGVGVDGPTDSSSDSTVEPQLLLNYFSNANNSATNLDATVRVANVGMTSGPLCAMVYVFDAQQEMTECCGCPVSQDGLLTLSVNHDLTNHPATGIRPEAGVIEIVSAESVSNQSCDASNVAPGGELSAWATHLQRLTTPPSGKRQ